MAEQEARGHTDCDSVSDDSLEGLGGNLQQGADPPGLSLAEDASHLERLALRTKTPTGVSV